MSARAAFAAVIVTLAVPAGSARAGDPRPSAGYVPASPSDYGTPGGTQISKTIFVNRCPGGCTLSPGPNDARYNTVQSSIVAQTSTLSEWAHSEQLWNDTVACLRDIYAPFDVNIVTEDPGEVFHHEAIVAGSPDEIGYSLEALGVAPISSTCEPYNNVISFTFANHPDMTPNARYICEIIAQESAHAFGLDHGFDCTDPMTYLPSCGPKYFRDKSISCGEFTERTCFCGGNAQNSHRKLLTTFGASATPIPGPEVTVLLPLADSQVQDGFQVRIESTDPRTVKRVEIYLNGTRFESLDGQGFPETSDYIWFAPAGLADGIIDIEARSFNDLEIMSSATITVTKGEPCTTADQCNTGQECNSGRCAWPPPTQDLGEPCAHNMECFSGFCLPNAGEQLCSELCVPNIADQCEEGFDCLPSNTPGQGACWPAVGGGEGCCSASNEVPAAPLALYGLAIFLLTVRRRRAV